MFSQTLSAAVALLLCAAATALASDPLPASEQESASTSRAAAEIQSRAKSALRSSAIARTKHERHFAASQLVEAFTNVQRAQSLSPNQRKLLLHQIRSRLLAVEQGLRSELNRQHEQSTKKSCLPNVDRPRTIPKNTPAILAQQAQPAPAAAPVNPSATPPRPNDDDGEKLLVLIQHVVHPAAWDINGGPSSGAYFQPLHALVITAPAEVQEDVGGVVAGLRQ